MTPRGAKKEFKECFSCGSKKILTHKHSLLSLLFFLLRSPHFFNVLRGNVYSRRKTQKKIKKAGTDQHGAACGCCDQTRNGCTQPALKIRERRKKGKKINKRKKVRENVFANK